MSPRTEKQYQIIRKEKRAIIKEAALELFANEGYHATSISKIARKAGISKGLMYNYFESKEDLLKEIVHDSSYVMVSYFDPNKDGVLTKQEFLYFIKQNLKVVQENVNHWKLYSALVFQPRVLALIEHDFDDLGKEMMLVLREFFTRCGCDDPDGEILLLSSTIKGAIIQYVTNPEFFPLDQFEKILISMYSEKLHIEN